MKIEIEEKHGAALCLVKLDSIELNFNSRTEAEAFVTRLQARLDAPHSLAPRSNEVAVRYGTAPRR